MSSPLVLSKGFRGQTHEVHIQVGLVSSMPESAAIRLDRWVRLSGSGQSNHQCGVFLGWGKSDKDGGAISHSVGMCLMPHSLADLMGLSAAAMIAGLLVMDPTLKIMIVTEENVAAHAFAKHFLRLGLPFSVNSLVGLVGYVEFQKGSANKTDLDVPPAFRNDVVRCKQVLIGCGGGFHQECSQPYSPVAKVDG